jgi:hypothetical protein
LAGTLLPIGRQRIVGDVLRVFRTGLRRLLRGRFGFFALDWNSIDDAAIDRAAVHWQ